MAPSPLCSIPGSLLGALRLLFVAVLKGRNQAVLVRQQCSGGKEKVLFYLGSHGKCHWTSHVPSEQRPVVSQITSESPRGIQQAT